jgi:hypothetical protein
MTEGQGDKVNTVRMTIHLVTQSPCQILPSCPAFNSCPARTLATKKILFSVGEDVTKSYVRKVISEFNLGELRVDTDFLDAILWPCRRTSAATVVTTDRKKNAVYFHRSPLTRNKIFFEFEKITTLSLRAERRTSHDTVVE